MNDRIKEIRDRWSDIEEYTRGRSSHPYKDSKEFASVLAKQYVEDVMFLLQLCREKTLNFEI